MKNVVLSLIAVLVVCLSAGAALADYTYTGSLSTDNARGGGINAVGEWRPIDLSWNVTGNPGAWHYAYRLDTTTRDVSHFLLETSPTFTSQNISSFTGPIEIGTWTPQDGNSNLEMPANLYGIKFNWGGSTHVTYEFDSNRAPRWGDFYTKDGNSGTGHYAWNTGFGNPDSDPVGPPANGSLDYHLLVPDTVGPPDVNDVPEPGSLALGLCALGVTLGGVIRRRRTAKR